MIAERLLLSPLRDVLADGRVEPLRGAHLTLEIVAPPYPCAGTGDLRVIRIVAGAAGFELAAAYEGYDRLETPR